MSGGRREAMRRGAIAVMALLRRDLLATSRTGSLRAARAAAIVLSGGSVLIAYSVMQPGYAGAAAVGAIYAIFGMLTLIAALSAPQAAIQSLRREREGGMLDLLVMAGLSPARLALGRILSTFVNLLSVLLTTLPALALLSFFGRPTALELLACIGIESCAWLALSGFAVAVSAWARSTATATVLAIGGLIGWSALLGVIAMKGLVLNATALVWLLLGFPGSPGLDLRQVVIFVVLHLGLALVTWLVATIGIRRGGGATPLRDAGPAPIPVASPIARPAPRPSWLLRLASRPAPLRDPWPLTWLFQRRSAGARPRNLALLLLVPPLALTWKGAEGALIAAWCLAILALLLALLVPAFQISAPRERHQWESLLATALNGRRAVLDLVRSTLVASAVPVAACLVAVMLVGLHRADAAGLARSLATCVGLVATWIVAALLGTSAGLVGRSSASAVRLAGWLALLVGGGPFLAFGCSILFGERALDEYSFVYAAIVAALGIGSVAWLASMRARNGGPTPLLAVAATWAFVVAPMFMIGDADKGPFFAAGGLGGLTVISWEVAAPGFLSFPALPILLALPHALLAIMLLAALTRRADRWLGRPA